MSGCDACGKDCPVTHPFESGGVEGDGCCECVHCTEDHVGDAIAEIAEIAQGVGLRYVSFSVNAAATTAIAAMPGSYVTATVYRRPDEAYVIRSARVTVDGVELHAQEPSRTPTPEEVAADDWRETRADAYDWRAA